MYKIKTMVIIVVIFLLLLTLTQDLRAQEDVSNKEILEYLHKLETGMHKLEIQVAKLEEGQQALNKRIDDVQGLIWVMIAGMFVLVGFVIWDRRTALSPVIKKGKELEDKSDTVLEALREYSREEPKLAAVLKSLNLL